MHTQPTTDTAILLATCNGADHLADQLDSLHAQTYRAFHVFARDDGSKDNTVEHLQAYAARTDFFLSLLPSDSASIGPCRSFGALLDYALKSNIPFQYFAFCDQDDRWFPHKLSTAIALLREAEQTEPGQPILVRSDLEVVDSQLRPIADSFWQRSRMDPHETRLSRLVFRNTSLGCASVINRRLAELAAPLPPQAVMHDWWVNLVAAAIGRILTVPTPLLQYRQHDANTVGSGDGSIRRLLHLRHWRTRILGGGKRASLRPALQAQALYQRFGSSMRATDSARLRYFQNIEHDTPMLRRLRVIQSRTLPRDPVRFLDTLMRL